MAPTFPLLLAAIFLVTSLLDVDARSGNGGRGSGGRQGRRTDSLMKFYSTKAQIISADQLVSRMEAAVASKTLTSGNRRLLFVKSGEQPRQATALLLDQPRTADQSDALSAPAGTEDVSGRKLLLADGLSSRSPGPAALAAQNKRFSIARQFLKVLQGKPVLLHVVKGYVVTE
eukprot:gene6659-6883_t